MLWTRNHAFNRQALKDTNPNCNSCTLMRVLLDSIPASQTSQKQDMSEGICIQDYMQGSVFGLSFFLSSIEICPALNLDSFGSYKWMSPSNINLFTLVTAFLGGQMVSAKRNLFECKWGAGQILLRLSVGMSLLLLYACPDPSPITKQALALCLGDWQQKAPLSVHFSWKGPPHPRLSLSACGYGSYLREWSL